MTDPTLKMPLLSLPPNRVRRNYRGGRQLDILQGRPDPADGPQPEDWIASTVTARNPGLPESPGEGLARVIAPDGRSLYLRDLFAAEPEHYLGRPHHDSLGTELGFLAKLLDSAMRLHVQAHPTAAFARQHLDSRWGKLETYVILAVRPGCEGTIRLGFQRPPSPAQWRRIILEQDIAAMDACFDPIRVQPGEVWVVPGGVPHAIGEGLLVLETMEPTDLVVRCEFEREGIVVPPEARFMGRDPDFALRIFDYQPQSERQIRDRCRVTPRPLSRTAGVEEQLLIGPEQTDCFTLTRVRASVPATLPKPPCVQIGIVTSGSGTARAGDVTIALRAGQKFLAPAAVGEVRIEPTGDAPLEIVNCLPGQIAPAWK